MTTRFFRHGVGNGWELNFLIGKDAILNIRIARYQFAIWWRYRPVVYWLSSAIDSNAREVEGRA